MEKFSKINSIFVILAAFFASSLAGLFLSDGKGDLAMAGTPPVANGSAAPARDGNIAIREELDMAIEQGTAEAYNLFIQRHPDHPLTVEARRRLNAMGSVNSDQ